MMEFNEKEKEFIEKMYSLWREIENCVNRTYFELCWPEKENESLDSIVLEKGIHKYLKKHTPFKDQTKIFWKNNSTPSEIKSYCEQCYKNIRDCMEYFLYSDNLEIKQNIIEKSSKYKRVFFVFDFYLQTICNEYLKIIDDDPQTFCNEFTDICISMANEKTVIKSNGIEIRYDLMPSGKEIRGLREEEICGLREEMGIPSGGLFNVGEMITSPLKSMMKTISRCAVYAEDEISKDQMLFYKKMEKEGMKAKRINDFFQISDEKIKQYYGTYSQIARRVDEINRNMQLYDEKEIEEEIFVIDELVKQLEIMKEAVAGKMSVIDYVNMKDSIRKCEEKESTISSLKNKIW